MAFSLSGFLTGAKAAEKVLSIAERSGDALAFTQEERAELWLESQKVFAQENSPRSISRRVIAWAIIGQCLFMLNVSVLLVGLGRSEDVGALAELAEAYYLNWAFVTAIGFYFGEHVVGKIFGGRKDA